ncbi:MAG TPA: DUF533 domain-containing protein [Beijerinckiaceae bacterium]|jgi:uncharacterized membrane protein YebE (DUF533 family)
MVDAKRLLDLVVGASSRPGEPGGRPGGILQDAIAAFARGGQSGGPARKAREFMDRNPGLAEAALMSVAGILLGSRQGRGIARGIAGLGGLAVVAGLAYKAFQNYQAGKPLLGAGQGGQAAGTPAGGAASAAPPGSAAFDPAAASEDDVLLFARAMVAAATADGRMDGAERARIVAMLSQAGIDADISGWLDRELAEPATVEELSDPVGTPEKAAQVYAAARVAVEPDTMQEREFLRQLAEALDLDPALKAQIDEAASGVKVAG